MTVLITGATGFIGKHLTRRLAAEGHEVVALTRPSSTIAALPAHVPHIAFHGDVAELAAQLRAQRITGIVHLASMFTSTHAPGDVAALIDSNVRLPAQLLEAATAAAVSWFINTGTFWQHSDTQDYTPANLYAATKQAFETVARYYIDATDITFVTVALSDTFGADDTRAKLFTLLMRSALTGEELHMTAGEQQIDISYIDNVIDGYRRLIDLLSTDDPATLQGTTFAISSGNVMTLKELACIFEREANVTLNMRWGTRGYRPREVMRTWTKGQPIPGWTPTVSVAEGIRRAWRG